MQGRTIAIPETRELDLFADLLRRRGAQVLRCPLVSILDAPDPAPVLAWVRRFTAREMQLLVLLTGEGLRRILACIERHEPLLRAPFVASLAEVRKLCRGPKPARALRDLGLRAELSAASPTTAGVIATLASEPLAGLHVGVQLYGTEPNLPLIEFLRTAGATPHAVAPYVYADNSADAQVLTLIQSLHDGAVDAIAFTSQSQVDRLWAVAGAAQLTAQLQVGMERTVVAAVGPVVADALRRHGARVDLMPEESFFLKPLTQALSEHFA